jgi:phosphomannomutase
MQPDQRKGAIDRVASAEPDAVAGRKLLKKDNTDGYLFEFEGGWLLVRPSGTEPLLRIYTEVTDRALVKPVLETGRELAGV